MNNPVSTYRIQFHKDFTLQDFDQILPYLQQLGVRTLYASPIFEAPPDSTHGYDGVNPHRINPAIGTEEQLLALSRRLKKAGMHWLQDIVPNHMAFTPDNPWLADVLEKGQLSLYAPFFDVAWTSQLYHGRLMVPFLGAPLEEVLDRGELKVAYANDRLVLNYYETAWPVHLRSYATILRAGKEHMNEAVRQFLEQVSQLHDIEDAPAYATRFDELRQQLVALMKADVFRAYVETCLDVVNSTAEGVKQIADEQIYRLCHYVETDRQINYRRFFTVNSLICLNIQEETVFAEYHRLVKTLLDAGVFQGLRIDHIDGLYDPGQYLDRLRELAGPETYIVVEKILEPGEDIPKRWPIEGNTGYDFLSDVNNLFTNAGSREAFTQFYTGLTGDQTPVHEQIYRKKKYILYQHMQGELANLHSLFLELDLSGNEHRPESQSGPLREAIGELLIRCPVYRFYGSQWPLDEAETAELREIFGHIRKANPELEAAVATLETALLEPTTGDPASREGVLRFYQRLMQFTGPLMAKGVEDTLMYTYNRFIGHNEVGDAPDAFGISPAEFHRRMVARREHWPLSINGTSTHDTKRGEDARARLNALTSLPDEWFSLVRQWQETNAALKQADGPDANDEYFIYQTLTGTFPMPEQAGENYAERLSEYLQKALREAKVHSNWSEPNEAYETAAKAFATRLLDPKGSFWTSFEPFYRKVADLGIIHSLAQVVLKFTCPGTPDVYQGTELWDLSLVDPDNRRAVAYPQRQQWLAELDARRDDPQALLSDLWENRYDGRIKLWLTHRLLTERTSLADLFAEGEYLPLAVEGRHRDNLLAFARKHESDWIVVAVPLNHTRVAQQQGRVTLDLDWGDTEVLLPEGAPSRWQNLLLDTSGQAGNRLPVSLLFDEFPLAVLRLSEPKTERSAGILLSITSLPSRFGIGDLGPEARAFANFLRSSGQTYWQLLPLNPTVAQQGHSPYSAISSRAGNTLLISPEELVSQGVLTADDLSRHEIPNAGKADFAAAGQLRAALFEKAYRTFSEGNFPEMKSRFDAFCRQEADWLDDFALYLTLRHSQQEAPWYEWPDEYKHRRAEALAAFRDENREAIAREKWLQFVFFQQFAALKTYCHQRGIRLFGDLPFYISYDSVDTWAQPELFALDEAGRMTGVAGVPPDYFSETGQLWGMPVFRWDVLKERQYDWWVRRIGKNLELYDRLRLDHFRAFADYWEVAGGEPTAINGQWKPGPRADLFLVLGEKLGPLPLVAEDLGEIDEPVYALRDEFRLPGMKVLQFGFGDDTPTSDHIPHRFSANSLVYTGTHDNNTTRGWFEEDASPAARRWLERYVGHPVTAETVTVELARMAYGTVGHTVILPMQDVLGLGAEARMNTPGLGGGNWQWRLRPGQLTNREIHQLRELATVFGRRN